MRDRFELPHPLLPFVANCSMLFRELPILQRPEAARRAGFTAVEFWWPFDVVDPVASDVRDFEAAIIDADVMLVALNFFGGDLSAGERGIASTPGRQDEFRAGVDQALSIGGRLGCRLFNALYGNRQCGVPAQQQDELATEMLMYAADRARGINATVLIEPLSGIPSYPVRTAAEAVAVAHRVLARSRGQIAMLADLYHLAANGENLSSVIAEQIGEIGHVQFADFPGRGLPGTGGLDLERALADLRGAGYKGWVSLECDAGEDTNASVALALGRWRGGSTSAENPIK